MKFYFNYFLLIGREHINCLLSTVYIVLSWHLIKYSTGRRCSLRPVWCVCVCLYFT